MRPETGLVAAWLIVGGFAAAQEGRGKVELKVVEKSTGQPVECRVHLRDGSGKPVRPDRLPFWRDHFVCPGTAQLDLAPGDYAYDIERGPEYARRYGTFAVKGGSPALVRVETEIERLADLASEGWWSGDLHVHRPVDEIELLMRAEDLHVAPVITWWHNRKQNRSLWDDPARLPTDPVTRFDGNRYYHVLAGEDEREGGAVLYFNLRRPVDLSGATPEHPSPLAYVAEARRQPGTWVEAEKPFWYDVPAWLASGQVDSIGLANNHMQRSQMSENEAWGKPRDPARLPPPRGNGYWSQEIYYQILNCGLRIPPSAGSASGVLNNPVGYDRVYVQAGDSLTYEGWWEALRSGRSFVTNGPLLRVRADGHWPGHVFESPSGGPVEFEVVAAFTTRDPVRTIEIVKDGRVERAVPFDDWARSGSLGRLRFDRSGWFLVRAIADNPETFRFASTAPFYVEIGAMKRRVSASSARFFLDWARERAARVELADPDQRQAVLRYHNDATTFWADLLARANAE
jgi:hypothetical protein